MVDTHLDQVRTDLFTTFEQIRSLEDSLEREWETFAKLAAEYLKFFGPVES